MAAVVFVVVRAGTSARAYSRALNERGRAGVPGYDDGLSLGAARNPLAFIREARLTQAMKSVVNAQADPELEMIRRRYVRRLGVMIAVTVLGMPFL